MYEKSYKNTHQERSLAAGIRRKQPHGYLYRTPGPPIAIDASALVIQFTKFHICYDALRRSTCIISFHLFWPVYQHLFLCPFGVIVASLYYG